MDPFEGPLFRVLLVHGVGGTAAKEETVLALNFHHLIDDGGSVGIFLQELWQLYDALTAGRDARSGVTKRKEKQRKNYQLFERTPWIC